MKYKIGYIILTVMTVIFTFSVIILNGNLNGKTIITSSEVISNKKIEWGIKREKNHEQPDLGNENKKILEKYNGMAMGNKESKNIYLTFDEGYEAGYTENILNILKQNDVKATFFITAHYLNTASDLVERMINEGHIVGNHTSNHPSMPSKNDEEIKNEIMKLHQAVYQKFNYEMKYIRPPKGEYSERTLKKSLELGYKTVMWSFAYFDWDEKKQPTIEEAKNIIVNNLHAGEIMLLHPNSKTNSEVLDYIIKETKKQGYEFKSLDQFD